LTPADLVGAGASVSAPTIAAADPASGGAEGVGRVVKTGSKIDVALQGKRDL